MRPFSTSQNSKCTTMFVFSVCWWLDDGRIKICLCIVSNLVSIGQPLNGRTSCKDHSPLSHLHDIERKFMFRSGFPILSGCVVKKSCSDHNGWSQKPNASDTWGTVFVRYAFHCQHFHNFLFTQCEIIYITGKKPRGIGQPRFQDPQFHY